MLNPFRDAELLPEVVDLASDNPYRSPAGSGAGEYDWTLARRIFAAVASLMFVYLLCGAAGTWSEFRRDPNHCREPVINTLVEFATNWQDGDGME